MSRCFFRAEVALGPTVVVREVWHTGRELVFRRDLSSAGRFTLSQEGYGSPDAPQNADTSFVAARRAPV